MKGFLKRRREREELAVSTVLLSSWLKDIICFQQQSACEMQVLGIASFHKPDISHCHILNFWVFNQVSDMGASEWECQQ